MWIEEESFMSKAWPNKTRRDNWHYRLKEKYIMSIVWTANLNKWQVYIDDKERFGKHTHILYEEELGIAKLKGSVRASELGWDIKSLD